MNKIYVYLVGFILLLGFIKWGHGQVYAQGYNAHKAEVSDKKDDANKKDKEDVKTIIEYRDKIKVIYRDKIKQINKVEDTTGCADVKLNDMGFKLQ